MRYDLHLICMSVLPRNNSGHLRRTTGAGRSQDHRTIWRFPTLSALLYKYSSIPYILLDRAFAIVADSLPFSQKVRSKVPPCNKWQPRHYYMYPGINANMHILEGSLH
jgi:hypothetical protein